MASKQVALVVGAGDAVGSAVAREFAEKGFTVCLARRGEEKVQALAQAMRDDGLDAHGFSLDARNEDAVAAVFEQIESEIGPLDVVVFNIGANMPMSLLDTTAKRFYKIWEMGCFAGFLVGKESARRMVERGRGTIIFTGATASVRGGNIFAAFASAKHGLRALAQSMAREFGPKNIHVAHVIIDGAVDTAWIQENHPKYAEFKQNDGVLIPKDIAANYTFLHEQPRNSWTFELDLRPWVENW